MAYGSYDQELHGQESVLGSFYATLVVDGETWPFSATAVVDENTVNPDYRSMVDGQPFRVVTRPASGSRRAIKNAPFRVSLENIPYSYLKKLENAKESGRAIEVQLLAFDARELDGVPLISNTPFISNVDPPKGITAAFYPTGGSLDTTKYYGYRISVVIDGKETIPSPTLSVGFIESDPTGQGATIASVNRTVTGRILLSWPKIAEADSYNIYGRTVNGERYLANVAQPGSGNTVSYTDSGSATPTKDPASSKYNTYYVAKETRWLDNPGDLRLRVNNTIKDCCIYDHNGVQIKSKGRGAVIDCANGKVYIYPNLCATDQVWLNYIWEPKVVIDRIDRNAHPAHSVGRDRRALGNTDLEPTYGVLYSPTLTVFEVIDPKTPLIVAANCTGGSDTDLEGDVIDSGPLEEQPPGEPIYPSDIADTGGFGSGSGGGGGGSGGGFGDPGVEDMPPSDGSGGGGCCYFGPDNSWRTLSTPRPDMLVAATSGAADNHANANFAWSHTAARGYAVLPDDKLYEVMWNEDGNDLLWSEKLSGFFGANAHPSDVPRYPYGGYSMCSNGEKVFVLESIQRLVDPSPLTTQECKLHIYTLATNTKATKDTPFTLDYCTLVGVCWDWNDTLYLEACDPVNNVTQFYKYVISTDTFSSLTAHASSANGVVGMTYTGGDTPYIWVLTKDSKLYQYDIDAATWSNPYDESPDVCDHGQVHAVSETELYLFRRFEDTAVYEKFDISDSSVTALTAPPTPHTGAWAGTFGVTS